MTHTAHADFKVTIDFEAIGTGWTIEFDPPENNPAAVLETLIRQRIERFDATYSRFRPDSLVSRMSTTAGTYTLPDDARPLLGLYRRLYETTDGAVTPLIGQTLADAGYDANYSLVPGKLSPVPAWGEALALDFPRLTLRQPVLLDFGALGKGYLIDLVATELRSAGCHRYCINAGGDFYAGGAKVKVALENPDDASQAIGIATFADQSLCGSAGNRRAWANYHHIIDPRRLRSPRHLLAAWTVARTALLADGLCSALFFVEPEQLSAWSFDYALVTADGELRRSPGFPAEFFI